VAPALFFDRFGGGAPFVEELIETSIADVGDVKINLKTWPYVSESKFKTKLEYTLMRRPLLKSPFSMSSTKHWLLA